MRTRVPVRLAVLSCLCYFYSIHSISQSISTFNGKVEVGLGFGPSFFLGDLGGHRGVGETFIKDLNLPLTKMMKGVYANFYPTEWLGFRVAFNHGEIEGYDSIINTNGKIEGFRKQRNLGFQSIIVEGYVAAELYPTVMLEQDDGLLHKLRPYGLVGFGVFHFNPKAPYTDPYTQKKTMVELRPLRTEGEGMAEYPNRKEYSLVQHALMMGAGVKYYITDRMYLGFEILHRKCFTDYLDDVSTKYIDPHYFDVHLTTQQAMEAKQLAYREKYYDPTINRRYIGYQRGDPNQNDAFFSMLLRCGWRLKSSDEPGNRSKKQLKCPVFY